MSTKSEPVLAMFCVGLSVVAMVTYIVAFACPYWIQKDFVVQVPGAFLGLPSPLDSSLIPTHVSSTMGLFKSCDEITVKVPGMPDKTTDDCGSDGAEDWQYIAAGFGIAGLVLAVVSLTFSIVLVVLFGNTHYLKLKFATICLYFLTTILIVVPISLYATKKEFQVKPPLPDRHDYDLYWAFFVAIASLALYGLLTILNIALMCCSLGEKPTNDPSVRYVNK